MRMLVLGAGLQGSACAYDLLQNPDVTQVRLADLHIDGIAEFLKPYSGVRLIPTPLDVRDTDAVRALMRECDVVLSAIPYYFNFELAKIAVEVGTHFCDLGGNTDIVFAQKQLDSKAMEQGCSVVPDCGVAPGMVNILAQYGISLLDQVERVKIFVGGLPQEPEPPLHYQVVYSLEGVLDYYTSLSWILRDGEKKQVSALSEIEMVSFGERVGTLEAFHTAGGLSTMAQRYEGVIPNMEYKTLRYPGHAKIMEAIRELGFLDMEPVDVKGTRIVPRDLAVTLMGKKLTKPKGRDLVAVRVVVDGVKEGVGKTVGWELVDFYDEERGISAMMRTTGYSLSITGQMQAMGEIRPGVYTPDECMPAQKYIAALAERGVRIRDL